MKLLLNCLTDVTYYGDGKEERDGKGKEKKGRLSHHQRLSYKAIEANLIESCDYL